MPFNLETNRFTGIEPVHIGDQQDPINITAGKIYSPPPKPKEESRVEVIYAEPIDELLVRGPAKTALENFGLKIEKEE